MIINEIFYSVQGEGLLAGVPSVFIRIAGCPLRCKWCDTKYALNRAAGIEMTIDEVCNTVRQWQCNSVVLTGGEPIVNPQLPDLVKALKKNHKHITIETAGVKFIPDLRCDLISISPKTSNSGLKFKEGDRRFIFVKQLIENYPYQLKFVVDRAADLIEIQKIVKVLGKVEASKVMLMPQARTRRQLIAKLPMVAELCKQTGYTLCNRLQILLFDGQRSK